MRIRPRRLKPILIVVPLFILGLSVTGSPPEPSRILSTPVELRYGKFDLRKHESLPALVKALDSEIDYWSNVRDEKKAAKKEKKASKGDKKRGQAEESASDKSVPMPTPHAPDPKNMVKALKEMRRTVKAMQDDRIPYEEGARKVLELDGTMMGEFHPPYIARPSLELTQLVYRFRYLTLNPVGRGNRGRPATNLTRYSGADLSRVDPKPSTFWYPPSSIVDKDLFYGFGRTSVPSIAGQICTYDGPHTGAGFHPSFDVKAPDGSKWRTKFGEQSSAPFGSRIMWALGYPTQISDYCPEVRVKWDRRIFTEFNVRALNALYLQLFGVTIHNKSDVTYQSPFPFVRYAVMKDGSRISPDQLYRGLFAGVLRPSPHKTIQRKVYDYNEERWVTITEELPRPTNPYADPRNYDRRFEEKLNYLVFRDANLRTRDSEEGVDQLGGWDYNFLDHEDLRELRGMAILQGWLDNWDIRAGNNRLRIIKDGDGPARLEHVVTDVGALFGNSSGIVRFHDRALRTGLFQESPNAYTWVYTHPQRPGDTTVPVANYMPISRAWPFYWMNMDDARWMARLMGQLTENQVRAAFIGAGYDAATARILLEKLASRRDHMVLDLGLSDEIMLWRPKGEDRKLSYDPAKDGPFTATLANGTRVTARVDPRRYVAAGHLHIREEKMGG